MMNKIVDQASFIQAYNEKFKIKFNPELFVRDEMSIVEEIKKVILSAQRDQVFKILVKNFTVIDKYDEVIKTMYDYEEVIKNRGSKNKNKDNIYEFVNLKDSDMIILKITYELVSKTEEEDLEVLILIPKIVDKYYFRINGNYYFAMHQIVEASTYNNVTSKSAKNVAVTLRTSSAPLKMFKYNAEIKNKDDQLIPISYYGLSSFGRIFNCIKYILAKYGIYGTMEHIGISCIHFLDKLPPNIDEENNYIFKKYNVYIVVPKMIYNRDAVLQSFVHVIYTSVLKSTKYNDIFKLEFWLTSLGAEFGAPLVIKGESLLRSLEPTYDILTHEELRLPEGYKEDIYQILRWVFREFNNLKNRDNLDVSTKRVRFAEYLASIYAIKLSKGIQRLGDNSKSITVKDITKSININPTYLLENIVKCNLVNYKNMSNDLDSLIATKFSYKSVNNTSLPAGIQYVHPSHQGRVDMDTSPKSSPGTSGVICPTTQLYDNSFSDYREPLTWEDNFDTLMTRYREAVGKKELFVAMRNLLDDESHLEDELIATDNIRIFKKLMDPVNKTMNDFSNDEIEYL